MALGLVLALWLAPQLVRAECPAGCTCNKNGAVMCTGSIADIPSPMPVHTYHLILHATHVRALGKDELARLPLITRFAVTHSGLDALHPQAFGQSQQLRSIKLSENNLSSLPSPVFMGLSLLEELHLDGNQITSIDRMLFEGLVNLTELDVSRNSVTYLDADVFRSLGSLRFLNLGRNLLARLPPALFHPLARLQHLMIYSNRLQTLEAGAFDGLAELRELKLHSNRIQSLPPRLFFFTPELSTLTLSSNALQNVPERTFYHLPDITKLTLFKNPLLFLPDQLVGHMPKLKELYLYGTKLTTVPWNLFANMTGLESLNLHLNSELRDLPRDLFCCQPNLQKLSLRYNNLENLHPQLFHHLTNLQVLLLNNNRLRALPEHIFYNLSNLQSIQLHENRLRSLPANIFTLKMNNRSALQNVTLGGNPWDCTCSTAGMLDWIWDHENHILDDPTCQEPFELQNISVASVRHVPCPTSPAVRVTTSQGSVATPVHNPTSVTSSPHWTTSTLAAISNHSPDTPTAHTSSSAFSDHLRPTPTSPPPLSNAEISTRYFSSKLVLESGPDIIHNNHLGGWVYLWSVPASGPYREFLLTLHVVLLLAGAALILASVFALVRLHQALVHVVKCSGREKARVVRDSL
ncbi:platelet glycoprotein V-like [Denticeps clupeoides]|uniref:platelet glycoprotein V-like n=1 Tax=Denticeps clupeoides TaxID=299321 RepID=UPI0010A3978C|nr:platelet glycoprotein V-like [Denticeps clupeoides]